METLPDLSDIIHLVVAFNVALNNHDPEAMLRLLTEDTVFENTDPPPDGERFVGKAAVGAFWQEFFRSAQGQHIEIEEIFAAGDRCVMRWVYRWQEPDGKIGHIRGVDLYTVRQGLIAEKLSYVKG
jgi:ketosteroid isomerase-like protein